MTFYTDIITYSPFEREEDLAATVSVLGDIPAPRDVYINKLYVLKNTRIAKLLQEQGERLTRGRLSDEVFGDYVRRYHQAARTR